MQEHELGKLGIFRIPLPIPFVQAGGPVNAYVVEEESGLLLFDPGLGTKQSQAALAEGLALIGHRFDEVGTSSCLTDTSITSALRPGFSSRPGE